MINSKYIITLEYLLFDLVNKNNSDVIIKLLWTRIFKI